MKKISAVDHKMNYTIERLKLEIFMIKSIKYYTTLEGRVSRKDFWLFILCCIIIALIVSAISMMVPDLRLYIMIVLFLVFLWPSISFAVRRLHDINFRGWWILLDFIPVIGSIILLVMLLLDGTKGKNRFGEDPRAQ